MKTKKPSFPDFMIIGPHRCGTSWLYRNLINHPQILFPCQKELHFFCQHQELRPRPMRGSNHVDDYRRLFKLPPAERLLRRGRLLRHGFPAAPLLQGDATACYATLPDKRIEEIASYNPNLKVILMVRDPIERAWSHTQYYFQHVHRIEMPDVADREINQFLFSDTVLGAGMYAKIIDRWGRYVLNDHLLIRDYVMLKDAPTELLDSIAAFLGLKYSSRFLHRSANRRVNPNKAYTELRADWRSELESIYRDDWDETRRLLATGRGDATR